MRHFRMFGLLLWLAAPAIGQIASSNGTIQSTGTAIVSATPDQAQFTVSVVTDGTTAQQAGTQNATQTAALIAALQAALGSNGNVQTIGYSISPRYKALRRSLVTWPLTPCR
ncbi:MAG TPA: SIMPL domain-containing protein [Bryobacteraceae bacterium]|nr:SIMPL domain-containing protein [Bryobacteraceae bacterium]